MSDPFQTIKELADALTAMSEATASVHWAFKHPGAVNGQVANSRVDPSCSIKEPARIAAETKRFMHGLLLKEARERRGAEVRAAVAKIEAFRATLPDLAARAAIAYGEIARNYAAALAEAETAERSAK